MEKSITAETATYTDYKNLIESFMRGTGISAFFKSDSNDIAELIADIEEASPEFEEAFENEVV